jgi:hypothetical protein
MELLAELQALIATDNERMRILHLVRELALPDCWVAAGFVRSRVWDHLHGRSRSPLPQDIDVIWFDAGQAAAARDTSLEQILRSRENALDWSVKNQARMHERNADRPYRSAGHAMAFWPETATAVGVRLDRNGVIEVAAPFGLEDLFGLVVRPTPRFQTVKHGVYLDRVRAKQWQATWPRLRIQTASA